MESNYRKRGWRLPRWKKLLSVELPVVRALQDLKSKFVGYLLDILYFYTTRGEVFDCMRLRLNANSKFDVHSFY